MCLIELCLFCSPTDVVTSVDPPADITVHHKSFILLQILLLSQPCLWPVKILPFCLVHLWTLMPFWVLEALFQLLPEILIYAHCLSAYSVYVSTTIPFTVSVTVRVLYPVGHTHILCSVCVRNHSLSVRTLCNICPNSVPMYLCSFPNWSCFPHILFPGNSWHGHYVPNLTMSAFVLNSASFPDKSFWIALNKQILTTHL